VTALLLGVWRVMLELLEWAERQVRAHNALEDRVARLEVASGEIRARDATIRDLLRVLARLQMSVWRAERPSLFQEDELRRVPGLLTSPDLETWRELLEEERHR